jgi:hypothetical protein
MNRRVQAARRELERLEWEHARALRNEAHAMAFGLEPLIRDARWAVEDAQAAERSAPVRAARRTAALLDVVLAVVAGLVMAFSLGNIRLFALRHGVEPHIAWFLAPMVDLALIATLSADAFLSRNGQRPGGWAAALRWFAGLATLLLNTWDALTAGAPGDVTVHMVPPLLLVLLAEAAPHYRRGAAAVVAEARADTEQQPTDLPTPGVPAAPTATATVGDKSAAQAAPEAAPSRPRRAAAKPRKAAAAKRVPRTAADLLAQARQVTAGWPDAELTAEGIRTALRVQSKTARELRDALKAERADARPGLHAVPAAADAPALREGA